MEDVLETTIAHGSSRLARLVAVAGLTIGCTAISSANDAAGFPQQTRPVAHLLAPEGRASDTLNPPETRQLRAAMMPPISRPGGIRRSTTGKDVTGNARPPQGPPLRGTVSFTPQRLVEQAVEHLQNAESSLRRQASYSAKASALEALRLVAEARDYAGEQTTAAVQLREGLTAIRESSDFMGRYGPVDPADIRRMIDSHRTPTLKQVDASNLNGASAADSYLSTARERLASLAAGNPVATRALLVLAEIYGREQALGPHADAIALNLLRAAMQSTPADAAVANALGFRLMKQGILEEAQWALERSMSIAPTVAAAQNLAEVMRQRGDLHGAKTLVARLSDPRGLLTQPDQQPPPRPLVQTLTPQQFAALSRPQQAFVPSAAGTAAAQPAARALNTAVPAVEPVSAAESPVPLSDPRQPADGPVGRVAKAVSQWFQ